MHRRGGLLAAIENRIRLLDLLAAMDMEEGEWHESNGHNGWSEKFGGTIDWRTKRKTKYKFVSCLYFISMSFTLESKHISRDSQ